MPKMNRWVGKVAVVTGASAGIGGATCVALANAGLTVVGLARRSQLVDKLQSSVQGKGTIVSRKCDVASSEEIAAAFKWIEENVGPVSILVNNAGVLFEGQITEAYTDVVELCALLQCLGFSVMSLSSSDGNISQAEAGTRTVAINYIGDKPLREEQLLSTLDVNVKGPVVCTKLAVSSMKRHGIDGHVITVNSVAGHYVPLSMSFNVYSASKYAITAFHGALAAELALFKSNIKTTSLSPGLVSTDMAAGFHEGRPALAPEDVADAVLYVISTPPNVNITELTIQPVSEIKI